MSLRARCGSRPYPPSSLLGLLELPCPASYPPLHHDPEQGPTQVGSLGFCISRTQRRGPSGRPLRLVVGITVACLSVQCTASTIGQPALLNSNLSVCHGPKLIPDVDKTGWRGLAREFCGAEVSDPTGAGSRRQMNRANRSYDDDDAVRKQMNPGSDQADDFGRTRARGHITPCIATRLNGQQIADTSTFRDSPVDEID